MRLGRSTFRSLSILLLITAFSLLVAACPKLPTASSAYEDEAAQAQDEQEQIEAVKRERFPMPELELGTFSVQSSNWAHVWIDGNYKGRTPIEDMELAAGPHHLELICGECRTDIVYQRDFRIVEEEKVTIMAALEDPPPKYVAVKAPTEPITANTPGQLNVLTKPWANVFVDNKLAGTTPLVEFPVSPGTHTVRLVCGECGSPAPESSIRVHILPGKAKTLEHGF